jgi:hypothetical protein
LDSWRSARLLDGRGEDAASAAKHALGVLKSTGKLPMKAGKLLDDEVEALGFLEESFTPILADNVPIWRGWGCCRSTELCRQNQYADDDAQKPDDVLSPREDKRHLSDIRLFYLILTNGEDESACCTEDERISVISFQRHQRGPWEGGRPAK